MGKRIQLENLQKNTYGGINSYLPKSGVVLANNLQTKFLSSFSKHFLVIAIVVCTQFFGSAATNVTYIALTLWALRGPSEIIQALSLSWLISFLTPGLFETQHVPGTLRWLVILAPFVMLFLKICIGKIKLPSSIVFLLPFVLICSLTSCFATSFPIVSLLKLLIFFIGCFTVITAYESSAKKQEYWYSWFTALFAFLVITGMPLFFTSLGYIRNQIGFQGLLSHPQAYGIFIAPLLAYFSALFLVQRNRSAIILVLIVAGFFSLYFTEARTGGIAFVGSLILGPLLGYLFKNRWRGQYVEILKNKFLILGLVLVFIFTAFNLNALRNEAHTYIYKRSSGRTLEEGFNYSRGEVIEKAWGNFKQNPIFGTGFGIGSNLQKINVARGSFLDIPVSAPIEKGFLPAAVLEETGIIGAILLLVFLIKLLLPLLKLCTLPEICLVLSALLVNIGESIFFSFGGMGLYMWLIIGFALNGRK